MRRLLAWCGCLTLFVSFGCAMCASPYDDQYAAYGGLRQRTDMVHGRVASVFDPAPEVIQGGAGGQSPSLADPDDTVPGGDPAPPMAPDQTDVPDGPDVPPSLDGPDVRDVPPSLGPPRDQRIPAETTLPELPGGTLELPEVEPSQLPEFNDAAPPGSLPPDLTGSGDRSAQRHPLHDLFDGER